MSSLDLFVSLHWLIVRIVQTGAVTPALLFTVYGLKVVIRLRVCYIWGINMHFVQHMTDFL